MAREKRDYFRRCHVCEKTSESEDGPIQKCHHCGKAIAPFFYFDEKATRAFADDSERPTYRGEIQPIIGLSAYWGRF